MSEKLLGKRELVGWAPETTFGAGANLTSSGDVVGLNVIITPAFTQNFQEVLSASADTRAVESRVTGPLDHPFDMEFAPTDWRFLKYILGTVADAGGPTTYTHTFTKANTVQSFKLEWAKRHTTPHVITMVGGFMRTCKIAFAKSTGTAGEGFIKVNSSCFAQSASQDAIVTTYPAMASATPFKFSNAKFTLSGTEVVEVNNGELTIDSGIVIDDSRYCNSTLNRAIGEPIPQVFRISGRMNIKLSDKTYWDLWATGATITGSTTLEIRKSATDKIVFTFTGFKIHSPAEATTNLEGVNNLDLVFTAEDFTSVVATDAVASYENV